MSGAMGETYGVGGLAQYNPTSRPATLTERIDLAVHQAEERLAAAKEVQDILRRNPDFERFINAMQKGSF